MDTQKHVPLLVPRLGLMMFLQYAVWGIWLPYIATYLSSKAVVGGLGFNGDQIGWILGVGAASGALVSPFIAGWLADRLLNAEIALGILLLIGGVINILLHYTTTYEAFLFLAIGYSICYMPTIALTNSICFANLSNSELQFPAIRTLGTIGWIVASTAFPLFWLQEDISMTWKPWFFVGEEKASAINLMGDSLFVSGIISIIYAFYAVLFLPRTPPKKGAANPFAFLEAFWLLRYRGVLVLTIAALLIAMIHNIYFMRTSLFLEAIGFPKANIGAMMSIGQIVEILVLIVLGFFLKSLGYKLVIVLGCLAYAIRFALFGVAGETAPMLAYLGIAMHGFCFSFFFAAAFLYIDRIAPKDARHSAQTAFGIVILGIGPILSGFFNGWLDKVGGVESMPSPEGEGWADGAAEAWSGILARGGVSFPDSVFSYGSLWWSLSIVGFIAFVLMLFAFKDDFKTADTDQI